MDKFTAGDKVKLSTGEGPVMVIERKYNVGIDEWVCSYWDDNKKAFIRRNFYGSALTKVQTPES